MRFNKTKLATSVTAAIAMGVASQASAISFSAGDVDASLYGYARLNMAYDIDENIGGSAQDGFFSKIKGSDATGHFDAGAYQSRVGLRLSNKDGVKINVEGDFYGGTFRLRHAYGEYNGVLAGQTWSNYTSFVGRLSTLDFGGAAGTAGLQHRQAQVRYTTGNLSMSIEDPKGDFYGGTFRLRHAYGEYNGVLAGQTWSNYTSFVGRLSTLDFGGAAGTAGLQHRQAQVRYTTGNLSMSIEDPKGDFNTANGLVS